MANMILHMPIDIWRRIQYYIVACAPREVTGIGTISQIGPKELQVTEIFLPNQCSNTCYCECDDEALNGIIFDLVEDNPARAGDLRFRWHSHANGGCFWSSTDQKDINNWEADWVVNLVANVRGDTLVRLDLFKPFRVENIPVDLVFEIPEDDELREACFAEAMQKVRVLPEPKVMPVGKGVGANGTGI